MTNRFGELNINAIAFDMDGLIFDTETLAKKAFYLIAEKYSIEVEEDFYKQFVGQSQPVCDQLMIDQYGVLFDTVGFRKDWWACVSEIVIEQGVKFKPGFHELFEYLQQQNIALALVTTSNHASVLRNFKDWDYPDRFHTLVTFDRGLPPKPAPDKYLAAAQDLAVKPQTMMVLEDSNVGMQAAINAGCKAVMIPDQVEPERDIEDQAFKIFNNLYNCHGWLNP